MFTFLTHTHSRALSRLHVCNDSTLITTLVSRCSFHLFSPSFYCITHTSTHALDRKTRYQDVCSHRGLIFYSQLRNDLKFFLSQRFNFYLYFILCFSVVNYKHTRTHVSFLLELPLFLFLFIISFNSFVWFYPFKTSNVYKQ